MRFKLTPEPKLDTVKKKVKFAFIPWEINGYLVWLEKYTCVYRYTHTNEGNFWMIIRRELIKK